MASVRKLAAHEWELLRALRLRALRESPDAFSPLAADVEREPEAFWKRGALAFAEGPAALFVAEREGAPVGLVSATPVGEVGFVGAMWIEPAARGCGLGRALLTAACDALAASGCARIELSVTETNAAAIALYESLGFAKTGKAKPLRPGSPLRNLEMAR